MADALIQDVAGRWRGWARCASIVEVVDRAGRGRHRATTVEELDSVGARRLVRRADAEAGRVRGVLARDRLAGWPLRHGVREAGERVAAVEHELRRLRDPQCPCGLDRA